MSAEKRLFGNRIEPRCGYCKLGVEGANDDVIYCSEKGVVPYYGSCPKFLYDPLKRVPKSQVVLQQFDESDFIL